MTRSDLGACMSVDGKTLITNYGLTTVRPGETMQQAAERRYDEWARGIDYEGCDPSINNQQKSNGSGR